MADLNAEYAHGIAKGRQMRAEGKPLPTMGERLNTMADGIVQGWCAEDVERRRDARYTER